MSLSLANLFKKTYKVVIVFVLVTTFFFFYNIYLVDHSLINLKFALNDLAEAQTVEDFQRIKALIKVPLFKEISKDQINPELLLPLETVDNIVSGDKSLEQVEDARVFLKSVISAKEKQKGALGAFFDRINTAIYKPGSDVSKESSEAQIRRLLAKAKSLEGDKLALQQVYYKVANIYFSISKFAEAENYFKKVIDLDKTTFFAAKSEFNLSLVYKYSGDYEKALNYLEGAAVGADPVLSLMKEDQIADVYFKKKDYLESRDKYAQLGQSKEVPPIAAMALSKAGGISMYQLDDYRSALEFMHKFFLLNAGKISFYQLNDLENALKYFSELDDKIKQSNESKVVLNKDLHIIVKKVSGDMSKNLRREGYILLQDKSYEQAGNTFLEALKMNKYDSRSLVGKALASYWLDQKEDAQKEAKTAMLLSLDDEFTTINALFIFINCNDLDEAIKSGEDIIKSRKTIKSPELYYNLGYAYVLKGKMPEAMLYFDRAIRLNREFVFAYNNLGCALWSLKNYTEAIKKFQEALDRHPAYADACFNLGIAYFQLNRLEEAYTQFERVLDINPEYREAFTYLKRIKDILHYQP